VALASVPRGESDGKNRRLNIRRRRMVRPAKKAVRQRLARVVRTELVQFAQEDEHPPNELASPIHILE
jgi:hypothetical protein